MQAQLVRLKLDAQFGNDASTAFLALIEAMDLQIADPLSTEKFLVALMIQVAEAESALPDNLKQNNFGYSIGEGGAYRATIKAVVDSAPVVIG
jgi:hypothetical protein